MKHCTVTVSSRDGDFVGMVDGFTHLPDLGLFAKKTKTGIKLITTGDCSSTLITISR